MGLFSKKKPELPTMEAQAPGSDESTPAPSGAPSVLDKAKADSADVTTDKPESKSSSRGEETKNEAEYPIDGTEKVGEELERVETNYPKSTQLVLITIALCLAVFCMALDNTIISTAIPRITDEFKAIDDVGW